MITMMLINLGNKMMLIRMIMINIEKDDEKNGGEEINLAVSMARAGTRLN